MHRWKKRYLTVWHKITENTQTDKRKIEIQTTNRLRNLKHKTINREEMEKPKE